MNKHRKKYKNRTPMEDFFAKSYARESIRFCLSGKYKPHTDHDKDTEYKNPKPAWPTYWSFLHYNWIEGYIVYCAREKIPDKYALYVEDVFWDAYRNHNGKIKTRIRKAMKGKQ